MATFGKTAAAALLAALMALSAGASDFAEWMAMPENAAMKAKFDALSKEKQADLQKRYEACKQDVDAGKLPKGTCKPRVKEELK